MSNNLHTDIAAIKNKFDKLIKFIIKEQSVECATAKVIDLFSDAVKVENHINQAYYQEDSTTFYLPNSNGIYITVFSGKGDIFGSSHAHNGTDLSISFAFNDSCYTLFDENVFQLYEMKRLKYELDNLPETFDDTDFSKMLSAKYEFDPYVYITLPKEIQKDPKVIHMVLEQLWEQAESKYNFEKNYENISPNGGFDIVVNSPEEHFVSSLTYIDMDILDKVAEEFMKSKQSNAVKEYIL